MSKGENSQYDEELTKVEKYFIGASPPEDNNSDWGNWVKETKKTPGLISSTESYNCYIC